MNMFIKTLFTAAIILRKWAKYFKQKITQWIQVCNLLLQLVSLWAGSFAWKTFPPSPLPDSPAALSPIFVQMSHK